MTEDRSNMSDRKPIFPLLFLAFVLISCGYGVYQMSTTERIPTAQVRLDPVR